MEKSKSEMYQIYELRDSLIQTREKMVEGVKTENLLLDVLSTNEKLKDTELAKNLIEQTKNDINGRHEYAPRLDKKITACNELISMYEKPTDEQKLMIDSLLAKLFFILIKKGQ